MDRPLFDGISIRGALDDRRRKLAAAIAELPPDLLLIDGLDDLAAEFIESYRMNPLVLDWDAMTTECREVEIHAGGDARRGISGPTRPFKEAGTEITHFVPFSGAMGLFDMRPSTCTGNPPRGFVRGTDLTVSYSGVDPDQATVRAELDRQESEVKAWVVAIKTDVDAFNADLPGEVRAQLDARFAKAQARADLVAALGVPLRKPPPRRRENIGDRGRRSAAAARYESAPDPRLGPGRPGWTRDVFEDHWREAKAATPPPHTFRVLAKHFRALDGTLGVLSDSQLGRLRRRKFPD